MQNGMIINDNALEMGLKPVSKVNIKHTIYSVFLINLHPK
jgi:hypothetical protein